MDQALLLRGTRDFAAREDYLSFLKKLFVQLNAGRKKRFEQELRVLRSLPAKRLEDYTTIKVKVGPSSTIRVKKNVYSVHSRLIGEQTDVRVYSDHVELWYAQRKVEDMPRVMGSQKHYIQYRHIIDWLVRKPGAFENYRYREDLFPSSHFRMAYDFLKDRHPEKGHKEYLKILHLASKESETGVEDAIRWLFTQDLPISADRIESILKTNQSIPPVTDVEVYQVDLSLYDHLLEVVNG